MNSIPTTDTDLSIPTRLYVTVYCGQLRNQTAPVPHNLSFRMLNLHSPPSVITIHAGKTTGHVLGCVVLMKRPDNEKQIDSVTTKTTSWSL